MSDFITAYNSTNGADDTRVSGTAVVDSAGVSKRLLDVFTGTLSPGRDYDYIDVAASGTTETYTFKQGGASGTTVRTITLEFTNSSREQLDYVEYS